MNKSRLLGAVCAFTLAVFATTANAALVVPAGLNPGDSYVVIFVTSTKRDATSTDITVYDNFVQGVADAAGIGASIGVNWLAVGSTVTVDAKDHLSPLFSSTSTVPIYNQLGELVSASFDGLWDGSAGIDALDKAVRYTENVTSNTGLAWTGTNSSGTVNFSTSSGTFRGLGETNVVLGSAGQVSTNWISRTVQSKGNSNFFYAMSQEITIPGVPVPAAIWLFGSGLLGLVGIAKRKKAA